MKIAVLIGNVGFDSQKRTINGILDKALLDRANVHVFMCEGGHYEYCFDYEDGEYNIYTLPDFTKYDGVILSSDTIHDPEMVDRIVGEIREAGIPCVDLSANNPEFMRVEMENTIGITEITQHLITRHNARNIFFISGPSDDETANMRLRAYQNVMAVNRLGWDKDHIYYGDYGFESGMKAARKFLNEARSMPDAIMAGNDEMAVGAILALKAAGYRVPEDIIVTGYDDSDIAEYNHPRLTTVRRGEYEAGNAAYTKIAAALRGEEVEQHTVMQGRPVFAESCGCETGLERGGGELQEKYIRSYISTHRGLEILKNTAAEFTGVTDFNDLLDSLEQRIRCMGIEYFYLCMCSNADEYQSELKKIAAGEEEGRDTTAYSDEIWIPFAYEEGEVTSYGQFSRSELLPEECRMKQKGSFIVVMPLHFRNYCFGYCITGNYRPAIEDGFSQNFILNLENALERIKKHDVMTAMVQRLSHGWTHDELTGVYSEAAFRGHAAKMIEAAVKEKKPVSIIFADIDELKDVNDKYGYEQGDVLIRALAFAIEQTLDSGALMCRLGGDEFIILQTDCDETQVQKRIERIQTAIGHYNAVSVRPFELSASLGYYLAQEADGLDLDEILGKANEGMYRNKKTKKMSRAEQADI